MNKYRLIDYFDVWGNKKEGFEVNNLCEVETNIFISEDATKKDIANYLNNIGYLATNDLRKIYIDFSCDPYIEIYARKDFFPIGRLEQI